MLHESDLRRLSAEEIKEGLTALSRNLSVGMQRGEDAPKTALLDFFGMPKTFKNAVTTKIQQDFSRSGCRVFCPPEGADEDVIRAKTRKDIVFFQFQHTIGVLDKIRRLAYNRDFHVAIMHRGIIDMLYWYERWVSEGRCDARHRAYVRDFLYEVLVMNLMDAFVFFTSNPETILHREYEGAVVRADGVMVNDESRLKAKRVYEEVIQHAEKNVSGLNIFHIDTTNITVGEANEQILQFLIPTLSKGLRI